MSIENIFWSPLTLFIASLIAAAIIYGVGGAVSPKPEANPDKLAPYACGEDLPPEKTRFSITLYNYAALFLIFDVVAMAIILSMGLSVLSQPLILTLSLSYIAVMFIALLLLARKKQ